MVVCRDALRSLGLGTSGAEATTVLVANTTLGPVAGAQGDLIQTAGVAVVPGIVLHGFVVGSEKVCLVG